MLKTSKRFLTLLYLFFPVCLLTNLAGISQVQISGPNCVQPGVAYTYTANGSYGKMTWCATGGTITGGSGGCKIGTPLLQVVVTWTSGTGRLLSLSTATGGSVNYNIFMSTTVLGGSITSGKTQTISYGGTPAAINCSVATGGSCTPSYSYQWQSSLNGISFSDVGGATSQNFSPPALTVTTYYR